MAQEEKKPNEKKVIVSDTLELNDTGLISPENQLGTGVADTVLITTEESERKIPRKAALFASALPGLGQAYNGSYWKIPIVYATFIGLGWLATFNNDTYQVYRRANIAIQNGVPQQNPLRNVQNGDNPRTISQAVESSRRNRDYIYILLAGAYALQIMEAITDSHLIEFDVNEELSFKLEPSVGQLLTYASQSSFVPATGVSLFLKIK